MAEWLKPFRNPRNIPQGFSTDRSGSFSLDNSNDVDECGPQRPRQATRGSSFIGVQPSTTNYETADTFSVAHRPENVYHSPSGYQMVEALKVVIMSQSMMDPIPIEYNSCIAHTLEAYQKLRKEVSSRNDAIHQLRQEHENDLNLTQELKMQWDQKEACYKAEIRRLEVLLSETKDGMDKVMVARRSSIVHGSRSIAYSVDGPIGSSERNVSETKQTRGLLEPTGFVDHTLLLREQLGRRLFPFKGHAHKTNDTCTIPGTEKVSNEYRPGLGLTESQIDELERQRTIEEFGVDFGSSSSTDSSSAINSDETENADFFEPGPGPPQKPLPNIPGKYFPKDGVSISHRAVNNKSRSSTPRKEKSLVQICLPLRNDTNTLTPVQKMKIAQEHPYEQTRSCGTPSKERSEASMVIHPFDSSCWPLPHVSGLAAQQESPASFPQPARRITKENIM